MIYRHLHKSRFVNILWNRSTSYETLLILDKIIFAMSSFLIMTNLGSFLHKEPNDRLLKNEI
jgi:hypothetical protein